MSIENNLFHIIKHLFYEALICSSQFTYSRNVHVQFILYPRVESVRVFKLFKFVKRRGMLNV